MNNQESLKTWLALSLIPGIGPLRFRQLLAIFESPEQILKETPGNLVAHGLPEKLARACQTPDWYRVDRHLEWNNTPLHHILLQTDICYPERLRQIPDAPPLLFVIGDKFTLTQPQLAMVGSRNPSSEGKRNAQIFAAALVRAGLNITSGLALGIDAASHQGALEKNGITIAVTGTGPDLIYPARHQQLAEQIIQRGALVTEYPLGTVVRAAQFPRRNRIISGLSLGTLVVEAAAESGSLITARLASEQNREVFAIPGSINNPLARGCNGLIREGAKLVETANDILEELQLDLPSPAISDPLERPFEAQDSEHAKLLKSIAYAPTSVDTLVRETGFSVEALSSMLLILELQGLISSAAGGCYYRIK